MLNAVKCAKKWHPGINKRKGDSQPLVIEVFSFSSFRRKPESSVFDIFPRSHALRGNYIVLERKLPSRREGLGEGKAGYDQRRGLFGSGETS